jgi:hypothetical protein
VVSNGRTLLPTGISAVHFRTMYLMRRNLAEAEDPSQEARARALERWEMALNAASPRAYV